MTGDGEGEPAVRVQVAELLVGAVSGDDAATAELVGLAMCDPLADAALEVVLELQFAAADRQGGPPRPAREVEVELEAFVRSMLGSEP